MFNIYRAYEKFVRIRFPLPTESQVADLERRAKVSFPDDYRRFILQYNGGFFNNPDVIPPDDECPSDRLDFLSGIAATHKCAELCSRSSLALFDDNDPPEVVPIGYTIMGNLLLMITHPEGNGSIMLKKASEESYFHLADGIDEFFGLFRAPLDET